MADDDIQRHRLVGGPDDGVIYVIDVAQCVTFSSLRLSLTKLSAELDRTDRRLDSATAQIVFLMGIVESQNEVIEALEEIQRAGQDARNREATWQG